MNGRLMFDKPTDKITREIIYENVQNFSHAVDCETIEIGTLLSLHINHEKDCIDIYKWASAEDMEADDYDFDSDYITTIYLEKD